MAKGIKNVTQSSTPSVVDWIEVYEQQIDLRTRARDIAVHDRARLEMEIERLRRLQGEAENKVLKEPLRVVKK